MSYARFFTRFLRQPGLIGAVAPSSRRLAEQVVAPVDFSTASAIVEYGPGTGVFSRLVLDRLREDTAFLAIEMDGCLCRLLEAEIPDLKVVNGSAAHAKELVEEQGLGEVDAIISGLPWACFPEQLQDEILQATVSALREGGTFSTFAYLQGLFLPAGLRFRRKLKESFSRVELSPVVWRNLPPALVYWCTK